MGSQSDALRRIGWAFRRYAIVATGVVVLTVALTVFVARQREQGTRYEATAVVAASSLEVPPEFVPRYAQAIFDSGTVSWRVARDLRLETDFRRLIPDHIAMDPVQDSIAFLVRGYARVPEQAARRANAAAGAFVDELNRGQEIGTFSVQALAYAPLPTTSWPTLPSAVAAGLIAGSVLAFVLMTAIVAWRRPLLTLEDAESVAEVPGLATLRVRRGESESSDEPPLGLRKLLGALSLQPRNNFILTGSVRTLPTRERVARLLDLDRATARVAYEPEKGTSSPLPPVVDESDREEDGVRGATPVAVRTAGPRAPARSDDSQAVIVVVEKGERASELEALVRDCVWTEIIGVVLIEHEQRSWLRRPGKKATNRRARQLQTN